MKVVLISLDALFDQDLPLMRQQPFFGEFLAHASGCTHVRTVYPALTYPAHTTLVTGVDPRQHGIGHNQPHHPELEASMRPWYWDRAQVKEMCIRDRPRTGRLLPGTAKWAPAALPWKSGTGFTTWQ